MDITSLYTKRSLRIKQSEIGELAIQSRKNKCISLGEGVPAAELFPMNEIAEVAVGVFKSRGKEVLQYGDYFGLIGLRNHISAIVRNRYKVKIDVNQILVTTGSTMCIDLCSRLFIEEGDTVLVETPSYIDAMNTLGFYGAKIKGMPCDSEGLDLDALESELKSNNRVKMIYVIPDFQNPTGRYWSIERRQAFVKLIAKYNVIVIEDNPYGEINYSGEKRPALYSFDTQGQILFCGSFSKTFSPGMRIGWVSGSKDVVNRLELLKEQVDLHSSLPNHAILEAYMDTYSYEQHVTFMCDVYKKRLEALTNALRAELPEFTFEEPKGGFFLWLQLPEGINCFDFFNACLVKQVSFVPGTPFFPNKDVYKFIRLNFTGQKEENIIEAVKRMKEAYESLRD